MEVPFLYLISLDRVGHVTWNKDDPAGLGGEEYVSYTRFLDRSLREMLHEAGGDAHLLLISDHGMEPNPDFGKPAGFNPPGGHYSEEAANAGVILLYGPHVAAGTDLGAVSLLDVFPTILALAEVPPPAGLPGSVITKAFRPGTVAGLPARADYRRLPAVSTSGVAKGEEDAVDAATKERLRALGYID